MAATITPGANDDSFVYTAANGVANNVVAAEAAGGQSVTFSDPSEATIDFSALPTDVCTSDGGIPAIITCTAVGTGTIGTVTINVGDGDDNASFDGSARTIMSGGAGLDSLTGAAGNDSLSGGGDSDTLFGAGGNDTIDGGAADDIVDGGDGSDDLHGGDGTADQTVYSPAGPDAISVTLDDNPNDGAAAEQDNVHSDVENIGTGTGNDTIVGSAAANFLGGDIGNDNITGGLGEDIILGGDGADTINANDGFADTVSCGGDVDSAIVDPLDTVIDVPDDPADPLDVPDQCEVVQIVDLAPVATVSPTTLSFGNQDAGTTSATQTVTVRNTGTAALDIGTTLLTGDFSKGADSCATTSLAIDASCTIAVRFAPGTAGAKTGTLTINDNAAGSQQTVALTGTGTTPATTPGGTTPGGTTPGGTTPGGTTPAAAAPAAAAPAANAPASTPPAATLPSPVSLSAKVTPSRDRSKPYKLTIKGKLGLPSTVSKTKGCTGKVTVTAKNGTKTVSTKQASLKKDCTYSVTMTIAKKAKLKLTVKFGGNSALKAKSSATLSARAG